MADPAARAKQLRHVVDVKTLEMLVCPLTKTRLVLSDDGTELISTVAHLAFPIRDGVPMLSLDEARQIDDEHDVPVGLKARDGDADESDAASD